MLQLSKLYAVQALPWQRAFDIIKCRSHHELITSEMAFPFSPSAAILSRALSHPYMSDCTFIHKSAAETHQREINRIWRPTDTCVALTSKH